MPNPFNQSAFEDERREQQHNRINPMTIEQAKIEIEQLEPVAEVLLDKATEARTASDAANKEWAGVWSKLEELRSFVKVSQAN